MNNLVKGFSIEKYEDTQLMEKFYFETQEGKFYEGRFLPFSYDFEKKDDVWTEIEKIPADAKFNGNYPHPKI
jgi:hypothetical protein